MMMSLQNAYEVESEFSMHNMLVVGVGKMKIIYPCFSKHIVDIISTLLHNVTCLIGLGKCSLHDLVLCICLIVS